MEGGSRFGYGAARLLSRGNHPAASHVVAKRPPQRHDEPLELCTSNLSLSSCDSPARPDGSARARRPPQGGWHPGIKVPLSKWTIVLRMLAEPAPTRVACTPHSTWPERVRGGWRNEEPRRPSHDDREVQPATRPAITRHRERALLVYTATQSVTQSLPLLTPE